MDPKGHLLQKIFDITFFGSDGKIVSPMQELITKVRWVTIIDWL